MFNHDNTTVFVNQLAEYGHLKCCSVKAAQDSCYQHFAMPSSEINHNFMHMHTYIYTCTHILWLCMFYCSCFLTHAAREFHEVCRYFTLVPLDLTVGRDNILNDPLVMLNLIEW